MSSEPCSTFSTGEWKGSCTPWGKTNSGINSCTVIFVIKVKLGMKQKENEVRQNFLTLKMPVLRFNRNMLQWYSHAYLYH